MFKVLSKFIQSLRLYLSDILYSYKSLFHEYLMFNITKETTICNYGHVREIFSQLNIYASYLASLNFEFNDLTKFETSFMLNLENSQVMFFFLLVPVSSFLDFGDREELVAIVTWHPEKTHPWHLYITGKLQSAVTLWCGCHHDLVQCRQVLQYISITLHRTAQYRTLPGFQFWINSNHNPMLQKYKEIETGTHALRPFIFLMPGLFLFLNIPPPSPQVININQSLLEEVKKHVGRLNQMLKYNF